MSNKGMTLIETLLSFSIFISIIVIILSCYNSALNRNRYNHQNYLEYLEQQRIKETDLWQSSGLQESINEVLH